MITITRYIRHLPKAIACCLLTIPCHAANNTDTISLTLQTVRNIKKPIAIAKSATVDDLKKEIQAKLGIPIPMQKLVYRGKILSEPTKLLQHYQIPQKGKTIIVVFSGKKKYCTVQYGNETFDITFPEGSTPTIENIKQRIYYQVRGIPLDQQILAKSKGGQALDDATDLVVAGIQPTTTLQLTLKPNSNAGGRKDTQPKNINVNIKTLTKKTLPMAFPASATVLDVKLKIKQKESIPTDDQRLVSGGKQLDSTKSLQDYNIKDGTDIHILLAIGGQQRIHIQYNNTTVDIKFPRAQNPTIKHIKEQILATIPNCPLDQQILSKDGHVLDDATNLASANIKPDTNTTLQLTLKSNKNTRSDNGIPQGALQLEVDLSAISNKIITINVASSAKIKDVKQAILHKAKIPTIQQKLFYGLQERNNEETLASCGIIQNKARITLARAARPRNPIVIQYNNEQFQIEAPLKADVKVQDIKEEIFCTKNHPIQDQILTIDNKRLDDGQDVLSAGIQPGKLLQLTLTSDQRSGQGKNIQQGTLQLKVTTSLNGRFITIDIAPSATIAQVKQAIQRKIDTPPENQKLLYDKKELKDNNATLQSCNITQNGQELFLIFLHSGAPTIDIRYNNQTFPIELPQNQNATIQDIKAQIVKEKPIYPINRQILSWKNQILDNTKTIASARIQSNATLQLTLKPIQTTDDNNNPPKTFSERAQQLVPFGIVLGLVGLFYVLSSETPKKSYRNSKSQKKRTSSPPSRKKRTQKAT